MTSKLIIFLFLMVSTLSKGQIIDIVDIWKIDSTYKVEMLTKIKGFNNIEFDTVNFIRFNFTLIDTKSKGYLILMNNFNQLLVNSNSEKLNDIYVNNLHSRKYIGYVNKKLKLIKVKNTKEIISDNLDDSKTINEIINSPFSFIDGGVFSCKSIDLPITKNEVEKSFHSYIGMVLSAYQIDTTKKYKFPYEMNSPYPGIKIIDTLWYNKKNVDNTIIWESVLKIDSREYKELHDKALSNGLVDSEYSDVKTVTNNNYTYNNELMITNIKAASKNNFGMNFTNELIMELKIE